MKIHVKVCLHWASDIWSSLPLLCFSVSFLYVPHDNPIILHSQITFLALFGSTTYNRTQTTPAWNLDISQRAHWPRRDGDTWTPCWGRSLTQKMSKGKYKKLNCLYPKRRWFTSCHKRIKKAVQGKFKWKIIIKLKIATFSHKGDIPHLYTFIQAYHVMCDRTSQFINLGYILFFWLSGVRGDKCYLHVPKWDDTYPLPWSQSDWDLTLHFVTI